MRRPTRPRHAEALGDIELLVGDVADREVGQIDLVGAPVGGCTFNAVCFLWRRQGAAKDGELEAEGAAVGRFQIAGVVPPFRLVIRMRAKVARKLNGSRNQRPRIPFVLAGIDQQGFERRFQRRFAVSGERRPKDEEGGRSKYHQPKDDQASLNTVHHPYRIIYFLNSQIGGMIN